MSSHCKSNHVKASIVRCNAGISGRVDIVADRCIFIYIGVYIGADMCIFMGNARESIGYLRKFCANSVHA